MSPIGFPGGRFSNFPWLGRSERCLSCELAKKANEHEIYIGFRDFFTASSLPFCVRVIFPPSFFPLPYLSCAGVRRF